MKITVNHGKLEYRIIKRKVYELEKCFIDPKYRKKGIATELIRRFLEGHSGYVCADVIQDDSIIIKILKHFGFEKIGKSEKYTNCDRYLLIKE